MSHSLKGVGEGSQQSGIRCHTAAQCWRSAYALLSAHLFPVSIRITNSHIKFVTGQHRISSSLGGGRRGHAVFSSPSLRWGLGWRWYSFYIWIVDTAPLAPRRLSAGGFHYDRRCSQGHRWPSQRQSYRMLIRGVPLGNTRRNHPFRAWLLWQQRHCPNANRARGSK